MSREERAFRPGRRHFLKSQAGILALVAGGAVVVPASAAQDRPVHAWVRFDQGRLTVLVPSMEMGQGITTALALILAEELDADWESIDVDFVTHDAGTYGNPRMGGMLYTAGSTSVEGYFDVLRKAGAAVRRQLLHAAAQIWGVPVATLRTEAGAVVDPASGQRMGYGEIAAAGAWVAGVPPIRDADLKPAAGYRLIGKVDTRLDVADKTRGKILYGIDVRVPGMLYAAVLRAPVEQERVARLDDTAARAVAGVKAIVTLEDAVAVVATHWEAALAAKSLLRVEWTQTSPFRQSDSGKELVESMAWAADPGRAGVAWVAKGDAPGRLGGEGRVVQASYSTDYLYHAQMEPLAAVASVDADGRGAQVWVGTQSQSMTLQAAAATLGVAPERIRLHALQMGGGFGRRTMFARELLRDALLLSRETGRPVKVIWTREDDVKGGWFRPATAHHLKAVVHGGALQAWHHRVAGPSTVGFYSPEGLARAGNKDQLVMAGADGAPYAIPNYLSEHVITPRRARISAWRGIGRGHNCFASEAFLDEVAEAVGIDAVEFRRQLLKNAPRASRALEAVIAMSDYGRAPAGRAHGLALVPEKNSMAAAVAEVSVDGKTGVISVHRFWIAVDVGLAIQPANVVAQVEGAVLFGISALLGERIVIREGAVQQSNFHDYRVLRMNNAPRVQVRIMPSSEAPSGVGELGVPVTGAAVANAFHALTHKRLRHMPFDPERVLSVLERSGAA